MPNSQIGRVSSGGVVNSVDVTDSEFPIPSLSIFCRFLNKVKYKVVDGTIFVHLILVPRLYFEQYETV